VVAVLAVAAGACTDGDRRAQEREERRPTFRLAASLQPFSACEDLQAYLRAEGAKIVGPYGVGGGGVHRDGAFPMPLASSDGARSVASSADQENGAPAAPQAGVDYSGTNVQETGVDEPDMMKTDGRRLVTMAGGRLRIVDLAGERPAVTATLAITEPYQQAELLLAGDRVLVLHADEPEPGAERSAPVPSDEEDARSSLSPVPEAGRAQVSVVDIADLGAPKVVAEVKMDGSLVTARMVDGVARLVLRSGPPRLGFSYPSGGQESVSRATEANRELVARSTVQDWLPTYTYAEPARAEAAASGPLVGCDDVARPADFSGLDMVSVLSVDAEDPRPGPAATVLGAGELVYASSQNLYVTTTRWTGPVPLEDGSDNARTRPGIVPGEGTTDIHKFSITDKVRTQYLASGRVPGRVLNQFSMSELSGDLRVATTSDGTSQGRDETGASESRVSVLRQEGEALNTVGSVDGLGKGERIYAVRFLGDRGYVVTFRQTDPLYVIDLADPTRPAVKGELKIPGYSAYLHPVGEHRLIGVGQEATEQGRPVGTQVSLFEVSDPGSPARLAQAVLPRSHSEAEFDHHAFLYWPSTGLTLLPVQSYGEVGIPEGGPRDIEAPELRQQFVGAVGFAVTDGEVRELGRVRHRGELPIRRSLVVGDAVLTLSEDGLLASDLRTLDDRSWLAF
jgi:uncharacterized secreted protein with C-terminal beta-propeller domain